MPAMKRNTGTQLPSIGETPAEARKRMAAGDPPEPKGEEVKGPLQPQHLAAIEAAEGGFSGAPVDGGPVEDYEEPVEPPTPTKAAEMIRQLSQDKIQLQAEYDAAVNLLERYKAAYGELD